MIKLNFWHGGGIEKGMLLSSTSARHSIVKYVIICIMQFLFYIQGFWCLSLKLADTILQFSLGMYWHRVVGVEYLNLSTKTKVMAAEGALTKVLEKRTASGRQVAEQSGRS